MSTYFARPQRQEKDETNNSGTYLRQVRTRSIVGGYCFPAHQPVDFREDALESRVDAAGVERRCLQVQEHEDGEGRGSLGYSRAWFGLEDSHVKVGC